MATWTSEELSQIGASDELQLASLRPDSTLRTPVTIWVVRHGDDLYVRSYKGPDAAWFRGTRACHQGRIQAGGIEKDVTFVDADHDIADQLDDAYRSKYRRFGARYADPMVAPAARASTIKLVPHVTT
jgi:hypothetical protein